MKPQILLTDADDPRNWLDCQKLREPLKPSELKEPTVLVKRRLGNLYGPGGEEIVYLPGQPCISLFTGAGGFDIGTERAGFCTVVQCEWEYNCCLTLMANRPKVFGHSALIQGDIRQIPTSMILREAGLRLGEAALLTGGPPCQGFTTANSNRGKKHDPRNDLVYEFIRVVDEAKPRFFIMENVPGFVQLNKSEYLKAFLKRAHAAYYDLVYGLVQCCEYGIPQRRCRFLCMGTRRDLSEIDGMLGSLPQPFTFSERDLQALKEMEGPLFTSERELLMHAPGVRYFPDREVLIPPHPTSRDDEGDSGRSNTFIEFFRKLERDEPDRIVRQPKQAS